VLAVISTFFLKDKKRIVAPTKKKIGFFSFIKYWKESPSEYKVTVRGLLFFTLFNSSDVFLLLKAKEAGFDDTMVIGMYIFYNLVYTIFAFPLGRMADKIGLKKMFLFGLVLFSLVYFGMGTFTNNYAFFVLFFGYGIYAAATEGISKAWISNLVSKENTATAIGTFSAFQSIGAMIASSFAGLLWYSFGADVTFLVTAIATVLVILYFTINKPITRPA
jgi:MFS family permease